jgi:hypothetical protein
MGWRRRVGVTAAVVVGACLAVGLAGLPVYVFPAPAEVSEDADLVYVIGPPRPPRVAAAEELRSTLPSGVPAPVLVSVAAVSDLPAGDYAAADVPMCDEPDVTCATPDPFTTAGEVRMLAAYAETHEVTGTVVLTFTPHVARTRYLFEKCYGGEVTVIGVDEHLDALDWIYQYAYQTAAFVKAWLTPCDASGAASPR